MRTAKKSSSRGRRGAGRKGTVTLDELTLDDADVRRHVALYADLAEVLRRARYPFVVLPASHASRWDRALFLNLTYWGASEGRDVLPDAHLTGDVVAHVAWHHLATKALGSASVESLLLGESIASAFDLYLVGRLLGRRGRSSFLDSQVPAMASAASAAGMSARAFESLLADVARDPERAFADLRALLYDATCALYACASSDEAQAVFERFDGHRFAALLHRYELSNWLLFARAHGAKRRGVDRRARAVDRALKDASMPLDWLRTTWVLPALA
jgi:hypothetical protein